MDRNLNEVGIGPYEYLWGLRSKHRKQQKQRPKDGNGPAYMKSKKTRVAKAQ